MIDDRLDDSMPPPASPSAKPKRGRKAAARTRRAAPASPPPRRNGLRGQASRVLDRGTRVLGKGTRALSNAASSAREFAHDMHLPGRRNFEAMVDTNPLILGAVGLGLGVVIGTLLPRHGLDLGLQAAGLKQQASPPSAKAARARKNAGGRKTAKKKRAG